MFLVHPSKPVFAFFLHLHNFYVTHSSSPVQYYKTSYTSMIVVRAVIVSRLARFLLCAVSKMKLLSAVLWCSGAIFLLLFAKTTHATQPLDDKIEDKIGDIFQLNATSLKNCSSSVPAIFYKKLNRFRRQFQMV